MILDFTEIPQANTGSGKQDTFELFARDFLEELGYTILEGPDRGADGKKDIIVSEERRGISGTTDIKWLVSCKHYAHSGKSVSDTDEPNIQDRVATHKCDGFIGFYSTISSVSLKNNLHGLQDKIQFRVFDREKIESFLLKSPEGMRLASRYFPESYKKYSVENPKPVRFSSAELEEIKCENCGKNLMENKRGNFVLLYEDQPKEHGRVYDNYIAAYFSCKEKSCNNILHEKYLKQGNYFDIFFEIYPYLHPVKFIEEIKRWLDILNDGGHMEEDVLDKLKKLISCSYQYVCRDQTEEEKEK
jgi:hypothetical protein